MSKVLRIVAGLVIVVIVAIAGYRYYQSRRAQKAGLLTEDISHDGDLWKAHFTARIPAPEPTVFDAIRNIENTHGEQVRGVRVVSQSGNKKTVEMDMGPGGQTVQLEFQYLPDDKKITYHTLNNPLVDTQADYQLGDEGSSTLIDCHQTTRLLQSLPVPDGFIKQSIRSLFVGQLEGLKQALHVNIADDASSDEDEP